MGRSKVLRWFVRMIWLAAVIVVYRSLVDWGPSGSTSYNVNMLVAFAIFAAGDAVLEWRWPDRAGEGAANVG